MNLFAYTNIEETDYAYITPDGLFLPAGSTFLKKDCIPGLDMKQILQAGTNRFSRDIYFAGEFVLRIGVWRDGYSFSWIFEKSLKSDTVTGETLDMDLGDINKGYFEIKIYGLKDSVIFFAEDFSSLDGAAQARALDRILAIGNSVSFGGENVAVDENVLPEQVLHDFIFPSIELCNEEPLYCRYSQPGIHYSFADKCARFDVSGTLDLLTYFNSFSAVKWAKYTNIEHLALYFDFQGKATVSLVHCGQAGERIIDRIILTAHERATYVYRLKFMPKDGILGVRITGHAGSALYGGGWFSPDPVTQDIKLGIGITTFKREQAVTDAVGRLRKNIAAHPVFHDKIAITVVDNGRTLKKEDLPGATLIPNKNLGGTGGFMRNLLHYQDAGGFTHCLFMDDDASCEPDSIFRAMTFISHAKDPATAIGGAMLFENIRFMQWESGAWFDKHCQPLHSNLDMRDPWALQASEKEDNSKKVYAAWWFFMFPLAYVSRYSFPFFVRGDDVNFSYTNKFVIVNLNGIATWQKDFKIKESPLTFYYDIRSHVVQHMVIPDIDYGAFYILRMAWDFFYAFNWGYQYDIANAVAMSLSDVQGGMKYWQDNMDTSKIRAKIKKKYRMENPDPLREDYLEIKQAKKNKFLPFATGFVRWLSLNGHLLPRFMLRKRMDRVYKWQLPLLRRVFLRRQVLVVNEVDNTEILLKRNSFYFFKNMACMLKASVTFMKNYSRMKKEYRAFSESLSSSDFWRKSFED